MPKKGAEWCRPELSLAGPGTLRIVLMKTVLKHSLSPFAPFFGVDPSWMERKLALWMMKAPPSSVSGEAEKDKD